MKLTLTNVKELKRNTKNPLTKHVCNYVIDRWSDYDDKKHIFTDVLDHGCQSGIVGELIYYTDTVRFYKQYRQDINELLYDLMNGTGLYAPSELFGSRWDKEDPLAQDISTNLLQDFLGGMLDDGYALDTVKHVKYQLGQYFEYCIDEEIIDKNPVNKVRLQSHERKTKNATEQQEYKAIPEELRNRFLQAISTSLLFKPLCLTSMFAGLRIGEVLALKWKDFDEENKTLFVVRAQTVETTFDENGNVVKREYVVGKTKTAGSVRVLPIPDLLVEALSEWRKLRVIQELTTKAPVSKADDFIFANNSGAMCTYYGTRTMFNRFLKKHGLDDAGIHFYMLRHTFSNTLFEAQENPKVIQALMGHRKVETTMIYNTATTNKYLQKAVDVFDARYTSERPSKQEQLTDTPSDTQKEEKQKDGGEGFLQNIARLMNGYGLSSIDELIRSIDEPSKPKK